MKAGVKTSEFYMSLSVVIAGILMASGKFDNYTEVNSLVSQGIGGVVSLVALVSYITARVKVKNNAQG